jgi:hypothetical protein
MYQYMGMWVYIFTFLKTVMHGLLYSLNYFSSNTYICTFSALIDTICVIRDRYNSKCCYFTSLHTNWNIWISFHRSVIKLRYSAFLSDYVKGLHWWTLILLLLHFYFVCWRMKRRYSFQSVISSNMHMWYITVKYA